MPKFMVGSNTEYQKKMTIIKVVKYIELSIFGTQIFFSNHKWKVFQEDYWLTNKIVWISFGKKAFL